MMQEFHSRIGIDRVAGTYKGYQTTYKYLEQFLRKKYKVGDIPLTRLYLPFIEAFDFYLRVERGLKPASMVTNIIYLQKVARIALHRNLISRPPFTGYKPKSPNRIPVLSQRMSWSGLYQPIYLNQGSAISVIYLYSVPLSVSRMPI